MTIDAWSGWVFSSRETRLGEEEWAGMDRTLGHSLPEGTGEVGLLNE